MKICFSKVLTNRETEIVELEEQLRILRLNGAINGDELESLNDTHLAPIRTDLPATTDDRDSPPLRALTPGYVNIDSLRYPQPQLIVTLVQWLPSTLSEGTCLIAMAPWMPTMLLD